MKRIKLTIEYDGTLYAGWQRQENALTVQEAIETAISKFCQVSDTVLHVAGRTDAGVHAYGQVAHVDLPSRVSSETVRRALNHYLHHELISILKAEEVPFDFHARFSAKKRKYVYRILNRASKPSVDINRVWHVPVRLSIPCMQEGAQFFLGKHDFTSFRTVRCQSKNPVKTIDLFQINQREDSIEFWVEAPSFLHHQVRNMVGTLVEIGKGRWDPSYVETLLAAKDRRKAGPTAPPQGLYFFSVTY